MAVYTQYEVVLTIGVKLANSGVELANSGV
jgi:hypothetical protein